MLPLEGAHQLRLSRASLHCLKAGPACHLASLSGSGLPKSGRRSPVTSSRGKKSCIGARATRRHIRPHCPGTSPDPGFSLGERASCRSSLAELPCAMSAAAPAAPATAERGTSGKPSVLQGSAAGGGVICVTGFGHFDGVQNNPTETLVRRIQRCLAEAAASSANPAAKACRTLQEAEGPEGSFLAHGAAAGASFSDGHSTLPAASPVLLPAETGPSPGFRLRLDPQPGSADEISGEEVWLEFPQGWTLGHCEVLPVVGKANLPSLRCLLTHPLPSTEQRAPHLSQQVPGGRRALAATSSEGFGTHPAATSYTEQGAALAVELIDAQGDPKATTLSLSASSCLQRTNGSAVPIVGTLQGLGGTLRPSKFTFGKRVIWVHLGVYSGINRFHLEERAWNEANFRTTDESGWMPRNRLVLPTCLQLEPICPEDGSLNHFNETDLPLGQLAEELRKEGFPVATSRDAGRFVCNYVYYHSLRECSRANSRQRLPMSEPSEAMSVPRDQVSREQGALALGEGGHAGGERWSSLFLHVPTFSAIPEATQLKFLTRLMELLCHC